MKLSADIQSKLTQCDKLQQQLWAYRPLSDETQMDILRLFRDSQPTPEVVPFEELLLQTITQHPGLNAPTLAERLGKSLRTTQRYLKILSEKKLIRFQGVAKKGGYVAV